MGPPSYMRSIVDRNVVMRLIPVFHVANLRARIQLRGSAVCLRKTAEERRQQFCGRETFRRQWTTWKPLLLAICSLSLANQSSAAWKQPKAVLVNLFEGRSPWEYERGTQGPGTSTIITNY